jgi:MYXO-CTERM domain-containing protein
VKSDATRSACGRALRDRRLSGRGADRVAGVHRVGSGGFAASYHAENTVDGSGPPQGFGPGVAHDPHAAGNHWTASGSGDVIGEFVIRDFAAATSLGGAHVWNHLSSSGTASTPDSAPRRFDLTVHDGPNGGGSALLFADDVGISRNGTTAQSCDFGEILAGIRSVRFEVAAKVAATGSPNCTGLAEVAFDTTRPDGALIGVASAPAPAPPAPGLPVAGLAGLAALRRRPRG